MKHRLITVLFFIFGAVMGYVAVDIHKYIYRKVLGIAEIEARLDKLEAK